MEFDLTDEQRQIKDEVRRFADNEIRPVATEYDREEKAPLALIEKGAEMGLTGAQIPVDYGGAGYDMLTVALIVEELYAVDPGIAGSILGSAFGSEAIIAFGTEDQKERWLPDLAAGEAICGSAISEPHAGSDVSSISTRAEKDPVEQSSTSPASAEATQDGDEYVVNGTKMWISNGTVGDFFVVLCQTDPEAEGRYNGFSQIVVEADRDGFESEKITGKMGIRASDTAELILDDVRVPQENLVGREGAGFLQQMQFFDATRTQVAAQGVRIAKGANERAPEYAQEREQFGRPIGDFQAIQHKLADMHTRTEAARQLTYKSAWSVEHKDEQLTTLASMAKEFASRVAVDCANECVQIHGVRKSEWFETAEPFRHAERRAAPFVAIRELCRSEAPAI
jgi:alkylation response protein AidB-like acyl-CoA dehydrogenase